MKPRLALLLTKIKSAGPETLNQEFCSQTRQHWLTQQAALMSQHGGEVTSEVVWVQHPYEEILRFVNEISLALIIKDAQEESALKRFFSLR